MALKGCGEVDHQRSLRRIRIAGGTRIDDRQMLPNGTHRKRDGQLSIEPDESQVVVYPLVAYLDERVSKRADYAVVELPLELLQLGDNLLVQAGILEPLAHSLVTPLQSGQGVVVGGLGKDTHRRPLDDGSELVGRLREFEAGLHELDAGPRLNGQDTLGLEYA